MIKIKSYASSSKGNLYTVDDGETKLLLEAGIPIKKIKQGLNYSLSGVAGCLISHAHLDHSKAANDIMKAGIDCYMTHGTSDALGLEGHRLKPIEMFKQFNIGSWQIVLFATIHDCSGSCGFLLQSGNDKLLFATDTAYIKYKFQGLTHIMCESNYQTEILQENIKNGSMSIQQKNRLLFSHMSLETLLDFLRANDLSKVQEIHLLHLSSGNSNAAEMKEAVQKLTGKLTIISEE